MSESTYAIPDFPWQILVTSNLNPDKEPSGLHPVDKNRFSELLQELSPSLSFSVENTLTAEPKHLDVDITFENIKDFAPDNIAAKVPFLSSLLEIKNTLKKYHSGEIDKNSLLPYLSNNQVPIQIRSILSSITGKNISTDSAPQQQASANDNAKDNNKASSLDNILNMTEPSAEENNESSQPPPSLNKPIDGLMQGLSEGLSTDISNKDVDSISGTIDSILAKQISTIIHHPDFIALETAWKELKFLVDHTNFREGVKIDVIACAKNNLCETLHHKTFQPAWDNVSMAPDLIVSCHSLNNTAVDFEIAENLAKFGQSTQTPVITWAGPGFFNVNNYPELGTKVPSLSELLKGTGYEKWRGLRDKSEADWLIITANSFCLRNTYGKEGIKTKTFTFEEHTTPENLPCGSASIAIASILSETFSIMGTEQILEKKGNPFLETLNVFIIKDNHNNSIPSTCIVPLVSDQVWDMADSGLMPINSIKNDSKIIMASTNSYSNDDTSISSMILAGHISRILINIALNNRDVSEEKTQDVANAVIKKILINKISGIYSDDCIQIKVEKNTDENEERSYEIDADVPYKILGDEVSINAAFSI